MEAGSPALCASIFLINPTPTITIMPLGYYVQHLCRADQYVRKWLGLNMTHSPYAITAERAIFLLRDIVEGEEWMWF